MSYQKKRVPVLALGLMLFALFFGAANLIFPPFLGLQAGEQVQSAILGFLITGVGLPLLAIVAVVQSGEYELEKLAGRVHPIFGVAFTVALYLSIGPLFAIPRTATVSYEIGIMPFIGEASDTTKAVLLFCSSAVFFGIACFLALSPSKLVDRIGKILTPLLLLAIAGLIAAAIISPLGGEEAVLPAAQADYASQAMVKGFLEGYNTMDALAALVFVVIVINAIKAFDVQDSLLVSQLAFKAALIAAFCLATVYYFISLLGTASVHLGMEMKNGAQILAAVTQHYFGLAGKIVLASIVLLACLTTAVGLISACASYFTQLYPRLSYRQYAYLFTLVSLILANKGLSGIIAFSIPVLVLLYPLTIVLVALLLLDKLFAGKTHVYALTMFITLVFALMDSYQVSFGFSDVLKQWLSENLPLYQYGLAWLPPAFIVFVISALIPRNHR